MNPPASARKRIAGRKNQFGRAATRARAGLTMSDENRIADFESGAKSLDAE